MKTIKKIILGVLASGVISCVEPTIPDPAPLSAEQIAQNEKNRIKIEKNKELFSAQQHRINEDAQTIENYREVASENMQDFDSRASSSSQTAVFRKARLALANLDSDGRPKEVAKSNFTQNTKGKTSASKPNLIDKYGLARYRNNRNDHIYYYIAQADTWHKTYSSAQVKYGVNSKYAGEIEKAYNNHRKAADLAKAFHQRTR